MRSTEVDDEYHKKKLLKKGGGNNTAKNGTGSLEARYLLRNSSCHKRSAEYRTSHGKTWDLPGHEALRRERREKGKTGGTGRVT